MNGFNTLHNYMPSKSSAELGMCNYCKSTPKLYFMCDNCNNRYCFSHSKISNGQRLCPYCYKSFIDFPNQQGLEVKAKILYNEIFGNKRPVTAEKNLDFRAENLYNDLFGIKKSVLAYDNVISDEDDTTIIDQLAKDILSLLNEQNNINIVGNDLSPQTKKDIINTVKNIISHPDL